MCCCCNLLLTWIDVYYPHKAAAGERVEVIGTKAFESGYRFFAFNGSLYFIDDRGNIHETGKQIHISR